MDAAGAQWCARYPTSISLDDLAEPFRANVTTFILALRAAGATVLVSATYRPPERAYLMHWSWAIAHGLPAGMCRPIDLPERPVAPESVPAMDGIEIDWTCGGSDTATQAACVEMASEYGIATMGQCAALSSNHTKRLAIDMTIKFQGSISVRCQDGSFKNAAALVDLFPIGAGYGVHKLVSDRPHWSVDGH